MKKHISFFIFLLFNLFLRCHQGYCLDGDDIVRLKEAGIDGNTIQLIISEKVIETCAFSVQEIINLKKCGMENETIRTLIESGSFMKDAGTILYGNDIKMIKFTSVNDIIKLKDAGISDDVIKAIISGEKKDYDKEYQRAWEMLENMGIIIDDR